MTITVLMFGRIAELTGEQRQTFHDIHDTNRLQEHVTQTYPDIANLTYSIAVNTVMIRENAALTDGDTVALMPPFSGG